MKRPICSPMMTRQTENRESDVLALDSQLCFPLYAASNLLGRVYRPLLDPLGLTYSQYLVMLVLWKEGPIHVGHLAQRLFIDSATMTPILKRMQEHGLLTRHRDPSDQRRVTVKLTAHGAALKDRAKHIPQVLSDQMGDNLGPDEMAGLRSAVRDLVKLLADNLNTPLGAAAPITQVTEELK